MGSEKQARSEETWNKWTIFFCRELKKRKNLIMAMVMYESRFQCWFSSQKYTKVKMKWWENYLQLTSDYGDSTVVNNNHGRKEYECKDCWEILGNSFDESIFRGHFDKILFSTFYLEKCCLIFFYFWKLITQENFKK